MRLAYGAATPEAPLQAQIIHQHDYTRLEFSLPRAYLDYDEAAGTFVPELPLNQGVFVSGRLPHWLWTSLALAYQDALWLAVFYPQLSQGVVVKSKRSTLAVGAILG